MLNGFINLYKERDISSNKALSILKKILIENNISTKVGHFGTLDPIADGVLPVALGRATRLFDYSLEKVKSYRAVFLFGSETDTLDGTGVTIKTGRSDVTAEEIESAIPSLIGEQLQVPPLYSAKNISGERAYKLARKGVEFEIPPKKVHIYSVKLLKDLGNGAFSFEISCGGGTFIRSVARDLAYSLGTYAIMTELTRTASGPFTIENAVSVENLRENLEKYIYPMDFVLDNMGSYALSDDEYVYISTGRSVRSDLPSGYYKVFSPDNNLMGIGSIDGGNLRLKTWLM